MFQRGDNDGTAPPPPPQGVAVPPTAKCLPPAHAAGKSTLVNALAQQEACIVDSTPGTTADVKTVLLELHALGPAKVLDTAGLDEEGANHAARHRARGREGHTGGAQGARTGEV